MRIFSIKDDFMSPDTILGYLIYYEIPKAFYVELPDDADFWKTPPILSSFVERNEYTVSSSWSHRWVQQRIVPRDRQNIIQILRDNDLKEYDEFSLLMLAMGRCEQDDCYLEEVNDIPEFLEHRWQNKVADVLPLESPRLMVFFRNGQTKIVNVQEMNISACKPHIAKQQRFNTVEVQADGFGVYWNDEAAISYQKLFASGVEIPVTLQDIHSFVKERLVNAPEACKLLECSRQNIDDLVKRDKLHPVRTDTKQKLFAKAEVMQRMKRD